MDDDNISPKTKSLKNNKSKKINTNIGDDDDTNIGDSDIDELINNDEEEYGDNVYDIEEEDDEDEETDDSDDDELYQISSEDEAPITLQDEDLQEDELIQPDDTLILLEISGEDPGFLLDKQYSLIGLDTPNPILKVGDIFYRGQFEEIFGTQLFFRNVSKKIINNSNNNFIPSTPNIVNSNNSNNESDNNDKMDTNSNDSNNNNSDNSNSINSNQDQNQDQNQQQTQQHTNSRYKEVESLVYINKTSKKIIFHKIEVEKKRIISKPSHI